MALTNSYVQVYGQLGDIFKKICDGQAPSKFSIQHLKDIGFASSNFRAVIPLLKALGFLSPDGTPSQRYSDYRNSAQSRKVMGEALRDAYGDLFTIKASPTAADRALIEGKFKSTHNATPNTAKLMGSTFYALLALADLSPGESSSGAKKIEQKKEEVSVTAGLDSSAKESSKHRPTLHYNIQIHLPATKDVEVFNAIFKSLKEHLLD
jgi:Family of unknown function (DUF5343)